MSKTGIFIIAGLILAGVAYQVLGRIPSDALNVAFGVMCGIGASIPVSLGLLLALTRQRQRTAEIDWGEPEPEPIRVEQPAVQRFPQPAPQLQYQAQPQLQAQMPQQPQIIVVTPQGQYLGGQLPQGLQFPPQWTNQQYPFMHEQVNAVDAREWRIIGEE